MNSDTHSILDGLNKEQRHAAVHIHGPLLVLAGAGTGKTRVVTTRIANLLAHGVNAENILALTFTRKAGTEMQERVTELVGDRSKKMRISTFHSLGLAIIRENCSRAGLPGRFRICDEQTQWQIAEELFDRLGESQDKPDSAAALRHAISRAKNTGRKPNKAIETAVRDYDAQLRRRELIDFDDMVGLSVQVLEESEAVRNAYQRRYRYLLVDEYQDTSSLQYRLLRCLLGPQQNIFVVGDDDQSIYGFRGADRELILRFGRDFPSSRMCKLTRNYRCSLEVVRVANAVIAKGRRYRKRLKANLGRSGPVQLMQLSDERAEAQFVAMAIAALRGKSNLTDIAVLVRVHSQADEMKHHFRSCGIPVDSANNGVNVLTLHAAKGLEFPVVFLPGMEEDSLPNWNAVQAGQSAIEEERRLFYVGVTRAKQQLTMTYCNRRRTHARQPSRFLKGLRWRRLVRFANIES
jgi:DNA helicase-2/ATP-dependent DNA helicase PcrA